MVKLQISERGWPIVDISQLREHTVSKTFTEPTASRQNVLKNTNHAGLRLVEDHVIDFVVAVDQRSHVLGLLLLVLEEANQLVKVRQLADLLLGLDIRDLGLHLADGLPGLGLARVEAVVLAKLLKPDLVEVDLVELGECLDGSLPQCRALFSREAGHGEVLKDTAVEKLHDVKRRTDDTVVLTEAVGLGDGYIGLLKGMQNAVFAFDLVGRLGDELAWGLLAQDILVTLGIGNLIGRVGLTKAKLWSSG